MRPDDSLSAPDLRQALSISKATYYRWLKSGKLVGVMVGGRRRFPRRIVDEILGRGGMSIAARERDLTEARRILEDRLRDRGRTAEAVEALGNAASSPEEAIALMVVDHALARSASDVHLEPVADGLGIRERIHGVLTEVPPPLPIGAARALIRALKSRAGMDLDLENGPQMGRFFADHLDRKIDVRTTTFPTGLGESLTLRLLDPAAVSVRLADAGFTPTLAVGIREAVSRPSGVFIVNGPTGSGKSTTLYCLLNELKRPGLKLMTVEDPVEFHIDGVLQANVVPNMDFAAGLMAMLRNDLDIGLVSEVRDTETAGLLFTAASTGHLLLTALHAPDAVSAIHRILEVGEIRPRMLAENLRGVLDQRLLPVSCPHCRTPKPVSREDADRLRLTGRIRRRRMSANEGCEKCNGTGVLGRTVVAELVGVDSALSAAIESGSAGPEDLRAALPADHRTLLADVHEKLAEGTVSPRAAVDALGL